jgi:hypothetical protein
MDTALSSVVLLSTSCIQRIAFYFFSPESSEISCLGKIQGVSGTSVHFLDVLDIYSLIELVVERVKQR